MKWNFLYQITAASRTPDWGATAPKIPVLSVVCPQLNLLNPPEQNSWVRHCFIAWKSKHKDDSLHSMDTNKLHFILYTATGSEKDINGEN